jgi:hypothetical protein
VATPARSRQARVHGIQGLSPCRTVSPPRNQRAILQLYDATAYDAYRPPRPLSWACLAPPSHRWLPAASPTAPPPAADRPVRRCPAPRGTAPRFITRAHGHLQRGFAHVDAHEAVRRWSGALWRVHRLHQLSPPRPRPSRPCEIRAQAPRLLFGFLGERGATTQASVRSGGPRRKRAIAPLVSNNVHNHDTTRERTGRDPSPNRRWNRRRGHPSETRSETVSAW